MGCIGGGGATGGQSLVAILWPTCLAGWLADWLTGWQFNECMKPKGEGRFRISYRVRWPLGGEVPYIVPGEVVPWRGDQRCADHAVTHTHTRWCCTHEQGHGTAHEVDTVW